jgi:hypothetical protein
VRRCCRQEKKDSLPVPEPHEIEQSLVVFEEIQNEMHIISKELVRIKHVTQTILDKSSEEKKEPFGTKVRISVADLRTNAKRVILGTTVYTVYSLLDGWYLLLFNLATVIHFPSVFVQDWIRNLFVPDLGPERQS